MEYVGVKSALFVQASDEQHMRSSMSIVFESVLVVRKQDREIMERIWKIYYRTRYFMSLITESLIFFKQNYSYQFTYSTVS